MRAVSDYLRVLELAVRRLDAAGIPYMLSGSTALGVYGWPRATRDVDLVVDAHPKDAARLAEAFQADFYCDAEAVARAVRERQMVNAIHLETLVKVDLIVRKEEPYRREEFRRRQRRALGGAMVWVVAPEDLVLSKLAGARAGGSAIQLDDARALLQSGVPLDREYLHAWAARLSVADLLAEVGE